MRACGSPHVSRGAQAKLRTWVVLVGSAEGVNEKGMWGLQKEMQMDLPRDREGRVNRPWAKLKQKKTKRGSLGEM